MTKRLTKSKIKKIIDTDHSVKAMKDGKVDLAIDEFINEEGLTAESAMALLDNEEDLTEFHPANDAYNFEVLRLMQEIKRRAKRLDDKEKLALEHLVKNTSLKAIKKRTGITLTGKDVEVTKVVKLASLISSLFLLRSGVTKKQRSNMLWRIAVRNEIKRPDLAIAAVSTINKMFGDNTPVRVDGSGGGGGGLTIIVQNQALANSPLDAVEVGNG